MPIIDALGAAAGEFSKGYLQARMFGAQQAIQAHQQNLQDIDALSKVADQAPQGSPIQEQLRMMLHDRLDTLPKPPKTGSAATAGGQSTGGGGIKGFFQKVFSGGKGPQAPANTNPSSLMPEADKESTGAPPSGPEPVVPGSQTFGGLPMSMTPPVQAPTAQPATAMAATAPPPTIQSPAAGAPAGQPQAAGFGADVAMPTPDEAKRYGLENWYKNPQYGFVDPKTGQATKPQFVQNQQAIADTAHQFAYAHAHTALNAVDQHIENYNSQHPDSPIRTEADIYANPQIAPEYKHVADTIRAYENEKLIPASGPNGEKGTLDQWRQQFEDVRPGYDKLQADRLAVERILSKPEALRTDAEKGRVTGWKSRLQAEEDAKTTPDQAEQKRVNDAFGLLAQHPEMAARPEAFASATEPVVQRQLSDIRDAQNTVSAYTNKLKATDQAKMTPDQKLQSDWMTAYDKQNPNAKVDAKARDFVARFHPPQPITPQVVPGLSTGQTTATYKVLNRTTGKFEDTNIQVDKEHPFVPNRFEKEVTVQIPSTVNPKVMEQQKVKGFDVDALMAAHASKDPSVTLDTLSTLLNSGAAFSPADRTKLANYIKSKANPF